MWTRINAMRGAKTRRKIARHRAIASKLWDNFESAAQACLDNGGCVAIEWPRSCLYWHWRKVKRLIIRNNISKCYLDGCAFGLKSRHPDRADKFFRKPWTIATNFPDIFIKHCGKRCPGNHEHTPTQGSDTKPSESYTIPLARAIHRFWRDLAKSDRFSRSP